MPISDSGLRRRTAGLARRRSRSFSTLTSYFPTKTQTAERSKMLARMTHEKFFTGECGVWIITAFSSMKRISKFHPWCMPAEGESKVTHRMTQEPSHHQFSHSQQSERKIHCS